MRHVVAAVWVTSGVALGSGAALAEDGAARVDRLSVRGGTSFQISRARDPDSQAPRDEFLFGPTIGYDRSLVDDLVRVGADFSLLFATEHINLPLSIHAKLPLREGNWEFYVAPAFVMNPRLFGEDRSQQEDREDEFSLGVALDLGTEYKFTETAGLIIAGGYTFTPINSVIEHQLALTVGVGIAL